MGREGSGAWHEGDHRTTLRWRRLVQLGVLIVLVLPGDNSWDTAELGFGWLSSQKFMCWKFHPYCVNVEAMETLRGEGLGAGTVE